MKQAGLLNRDWSLVMKMMHSHQQVNDYDCGLYIIENAQAVINCWNRPEVMKNAPWINVFNCLYDTVMQNWGWTEKEVAWLSQKRTVGRSPELGSLVRSQISLLSEALSGMTTPPALSTLMRQLGLLNMIFSWQELRQSGRNKGHKKHWDWEVLIKRHNEDANWADEVTILSGWSCRLSAQW